jgi:cyclic pyranopterin phosphate synthase
VKNDQPSTAKLFEVQGFNGYIGVIEGHSRKFCSQCNKLRITPLGILKTCLYDNGVIDLKEMIRSGIDDDTIMSKIVEAVNSRFINGRVAELACRQRGEPSMASIGG